jgi:hypothetical protein
MTRPGIRAFLPVGLALLGLAPLQASEKARSFSIRFADEKAAVFVPKKFEPLLPGSVYPNRHKPVAAEGCPVAIVRKGPDLSSQPRETLLERGFVVVECRCASPGDYAALLGALASHIEADVRGAFVIAEGIGSISPGPRIRAWAIFDPPSSEPRDPVASRGPVAVFLRTPDLTPSNALSESFRKRFGENVVEKWYRSEKGFPEQAFHDAAEWLAQLARP